ncbi:MAG: hypothetical protein RBR35_03765 [Salinivirgaceae bacterium]|nr:hypothetical protein [Salinivirgaceae bacterium]
MQNSTIPIEVQILTPKIFLNLLRQNKIVLKEPRKQVLRSTIQKIIASKEPTEKTYCQIGFCKN